MPQLACYPCCRQSTYAVLLNMLLFGSVFSTGAKFLKQEIKAGQNATLNCPFTSADVTWLRNNVPIEGYAHNESFVYSSLSNEADVGFKSSVDNQLLIKHISLSLAGNYTCLDRTRNHNIIDFELFVFIPPRIVQKSTDTVKKRNGANVEIFCTFELFPQSPSFHGALRWYKEGQILTLDESIRVVAINDSHINYTIQFTEVYGNDTGSYECEFSAKEGKVYDKAQIRLLVMDVPKVSIDFAKAVGAHKVFLNWTSNDGNDPIQKFFIQFSQEGSPTFTYYKDAIGGGNNSYILDNLHPNTTYYFRISGKNSVGNGIPLQYHNSIRTLNVDPIFIPRVETTGSTSSTITIGWDPPPPELLDFIQYYELIVSESGDIPKIVEEAVYQQNSRNLPYMFDNLKTATDYEFKVRSCNELTKQCGPWSKTINGTTMDGAASEPTDLIIRCNHHNISRLNSVAITWNPPKYPNGKVVSYLISLKGTSLYRADNKWATEIWGPKIRRVDEPHHKTVYDGASPNTNYTVTVSAITRHKKSGLLSEGKCFMPPSVPESITPTTWSKVKIDSMKLILKIHLPAISERFGPICCYRVYLMRVPIAFKDLPPPGQQNISTYYQVHNANNSDGGAYMIEMMSGSRFQKELYAGDKKRFTDDVNIISENDEMCKKCTQDLEYSVFDKTLENPLPSRTPNNYSFDNDTIPAKLPADHKLSENVSTAISYLFDGEISFDSNYTGFLEIIVRNGTTTLQKYSDYFDLITPDTQMESNPYLERFISYVFTALDYIIKIIGILIIIVCTLWIFSLCLRNTINGHEEVTNGIDYLRLLLGFGNPNHSRFISSGNHKGFDISPIPKNEILQAYITRHKDTDYGFLREYEVLPNRFGDRTTKNSDMKENAAKNRYPDIKAYDQTRVKLSASDGIVGSDYINANFVIGYKERKKFICAQGPMENTIQDFWHMIWEQHLEIILMLTNLEEYNKTKCSKYWPDKLMDVKQCGDIIVKFVEERKTGDYVMRMLDVTRRNSNGNEDEHRNITQYHYLSWKDFMAPEYPHGILRFIRKVNTIYSLQRGPILVHCSAGVGRTGTLVALDSLMQQLQEEHMISIFNTVCDLRHQRNFLVQSLKQYIFLYRALLDTATFGNTELSLSSLSAAVDTLRTKPFDGGNRCKMEIEFEKMLSFCDETNKSCCIAQSEENACKNRSETVVPYDRNRVILNPIPSRDNSTYINASFIEGYDNSDTFIITQDPLDHTIGDFWRMVSEQSISTLVMISEIGDGARKCPRYWADEEINYDHILVKYVQSESCPYYTRREFEVTNCKIADTLTVTQFQYNGWPTVNGEVPEVCRGVIELVDQAYHHYTIRKGFACRSPLAVHCSLGADRSSIFVAMCILVQQLRLEKSIDICSVARKLQSQRIGLIDTYAQYEFLHRAVVNYADLHKLSESQSN